MKKNLGLVACMFIIFVVNSQAIDSDLLFDYAKENSPILQNAKADVLISDEKIKEIKSSGMPKINGEFSFQNFINVPTTVVPANAFSPAAPEDELIGLSFGTPINASYSLQASQLIFSFSYIYALKAARNYRELALLTRLQKNEQLFEEIKLSLGQVILLKKQKKLLAENLEELEILKKKTNSLISSGLLESSSINDLLAMELDFQGGLELLINNEELAKLSLKSMIGYPLDSSIVLIEGFSFSSKDDFLEKKVLNPNENSSIKLGQQNVILNELNLKATKSEGYPSLFGFFNQQHMAMRNSFNLFDSSKEWYPATLWGINVTIPIYNSGEGKAKNKQKELELTKAKNGLLEIENRIFSLYKMLKTNYKIALLNYKNQKAKVELMKTVYQNEEKKLTHGASNSLTISQRKMQLLSAKQELIQKEYELYKSEVQLSTHTNPIKL